MPLEVFDWFCDSVQRRTGENKGHTSMEQAWSQASSIDDFYLPQKRHETFTTFLLSVGAMPSSRKYLKSLLELPCFHCHVQLWNFHSNTQWVVYCPLHQHSVKTTTKHQHCLEHWHCINKPAWDTDIVKCSELHFQRTLIIIIVSSSLEKETAGEQNHLPVTEKN